MSERDREIKRLDRQIERERERWRDRGIERQRGRDGERTRAKPPKKRRGSPASESSYVEESCQTKKHKKHIIICIHIYMFTYYVIYV